MSVLLAFDTATGATVVGAVGPDANAERRHDPQPGERPGHAAQVLELAHAALSELGAEIGDVTRIAVGVGPGSFTGLRIGVATARGLAHATGAELVAVGTLDVLAEGVVHEGPVLAVLDARRGEAFVSIHAADGPTAPVAVGPDGLEEIARNAGPGALAAGDGAVRFRQSLEAVGVTVPADDSPLHRVSAQALCRLAAVGNPVAFDRLVPAYVRLPDVDAPR